MKNKADTQHWIRVEPKLERLFAALDQDLRLAPLSAPIYVLVPVFDKAVPPTRHHPGCGSWVPGHAHARAVVRFDDLPDLGGLPIPEEGLAAAVA